MIVCLPMLLAGWVRERAETVYQQMPGYSGSTQSPMIGEPGAPKVAVISDAHAAALALHSSVSCMWWRSACKSV